jgi:hypothetical protein
VWLCIAVMTHVSTVHVHGFLRHRGRRIERIVRKAGGDWLQRRFFGMHVCR